MGIGDWGLGFRVYRLMNGSEFRVYRVCKMIAEGAKGCAGDPAKAVPDFIAMHVTAAIQTLGNIQRTVGEKRLLVVTKATEFARCLYGSGTAVQIIMAYVWAECRHLPKYDFDLFVLR